VAIDESVDLVDEGAKLVAGRVRLIVIELENDLVELVNQPITLVLRERATHNKCLDLSNERCDLVLGRLCFRKRYKLRPLSDRDSGGHCIRGRVDH